MHILAWRVFSGKRGKIGIVASSWKVGRYSDHSASRPRQSGTARARSRARRTWPPALPRTPDLQLDLQTRGDGPRRDDGSFTRVADVAQRPIHDNLAGRRDARALERRH